MLTTYSEASQRRAMRENNKTHLAYSVCSTTEALGGYGKVICWISWESRCIMMMEKLTGLVLQRIQPLASLGNLCDVLPHDSDGVVDLLLNGSGFCIALRAGRVG